MTGPTWGDVPDIQPQNGGLNPRPLNAPITQRLSIGVQPGAQQFFTRLIVGGPGSGTGVFVYNGPPGPTTLAASMTGSSTTHDPFGTPTFPDVTIYGTPLPAAVPAVVGSPVTNKAVAATTVTVTIPSTTAGNLLAVYVYVGGDSSLQSVSTITLGASSLVNAVARNNGTFISSEIWYLRNIPGGQTTVTVTASGVSELAAAVYEISGCAAVGPLDQTQSMVIATSGSWTSGTTATLSQASEIAIGGVGTTTGPSTFTGPAAPWVNTASISIGAPLNNAAISGYDVLSSTAGLAYAGTLSVSGNTVGVIATFKAAPSPTAQLLQLVTTGGVVEQSFFTGTQSESAPAQFKAGAFNVGTSAESQAFTVAGATNTGSNDAAFVQFNTSSVASPNSANASLEYQLPAGGDALMLTWGAQGVSRTSLAGLSGGIPLTQMDFFTRTATTTGLTAMTRSYSIPANDASNPFSQQTTYHFRGGGTGTMAGGAAVNATLSISFFGTNAYLAGPSIFVAAGHNFAWYFDVNVMMSGNSVTGPFITFGFFMITDLVAGTTISFPTIGSGTVNNTVPGSMVFNWQWASVVGAPTISCPGSIFSREGV